MKGIGILLMLLTIAAGINAQDITINSKPERQQILIGDQIHFTVSATIPKSARIRLSVAKDTLAGKIIVLKAPVRDSVILQNGDKTITDNYLITCYDSGNYVIHPFIGEVTEGGNTQKYLSNVTALYVTVPDKAPKDTSDVIYDIVGPKEAPVTFAEAIPWIVIVIVMGLVVWLLARLLPRTPLGRFVKKEKPAEPAHVVAYRELEKLRSEELWQKGEVKEFYSRLSDILRRYIDGRFSIQSPELTTDETVRKLQRSGFVKNDLLASVKGILSDSDMVKFAKYIPGEEINKASLEEAKRFVDMTRPAEITEDAAGKAQGTAMKGGKNE